jgi:hypothetical protein
VKTRRPRLSSQEWGGFTAKKDKKGKEGQKNSEVFLPLFALLVFFCRKTALPVRPS